MSDPTISPIAPADVPAICALARLVWYDTYPGIITVDQIEYMLEQRNSPEVLRAELAAGSIGWDQLRAGGVPVAFVSYLSAETPGEMKVDKLYVHPQEQRAGLGGLLLAHVAEVARGRGFDTLSLAVNKRNVRAIRAYEKHGFAIREAVVKEIGGGFIMDDYVMARSIDPAGPGNSG